MASVQAAKIKLSISGTFDKWNYFARSLEGSTYRASTVYYSFSSESLQKQCKSDTENYLKSSKGMDLMDLLSIGRSLSIKRLSISVSLKSLDSRANMENPLKSSEGEPVGDVRRWSKTAVVW